LPSNKILPSVGSYNLANNFTNVVFSCSVFAYQSQFSPGLKLKFLFAHLGIAMLKPTFSNTKPVFMDLEKLKRFGFYILIKKIDKIVKIDGTLRNDGK
jgi:hypothetical protein